MDKKLAGETRHVSIDYLALELKVIERPESELRQIKRIRIAI